MPTTSTVSPTSNPYINGLLGGVKWGVNTLTFSFPSNASYYGSGYGSGEPGANFEAFTALQQSAARTILANYAAVANLTFIEVTETSSEHGDLRYAESDAPNTAWAYLPTTNPAGGDSWFNNTTGWYDSPVMGNYAWSAIAHETGHALGLKHPHQSNGSFGTMPADRDSLEYTVMSYHSYVGSPLNGYTNGTSGYPQSLMMYDIAALQTMYGANYGTNSGDTVYSWSSTLGRMSINGVAQSLPIANKIFMTLWDGGGNDTYDFSNYTTNLDVDLGPGKWTTVSTTQLASLGSGHTAAGNIANALLHNNNPASLIENAVAGSGNDVIVGNAADNRLTGGGGNDDLDGLGGTNTAAYSGAAANYLITDLGGTWTVADLRSVNSDGTDTLANIRYLQFSDGTVDLSDDPSPPDPDPDDTAPVAHNDSYTGAKKTTLSVSAAQGVLANDSDADGDPMTAVLVSGPTARQGSLTLNTDGSFEFRPNARFTGVATFQYKVSDGDDLSTAASVSISIGSGGGGGGGGGGRRGRDQYEHGVEDDQFPAAVTHDLRRHATNDADQTPSGDAFGLVDLIGQPDGDHGWHADFGMA